MIRPHSILSALSIELTELLAVFIILAIGLAIIGMIINGVIRARRVKKADRTKHDRIEKALHSSPAAKKVKVEKDKED